MFLSDLTNPYLYDRYFYNDVQYIFNKEILFKDTLEVLKYTESGQVTTQFDDYANWMKNAEFGEEAIKKFSVVDVPVIIAS